MAQWASFAESAWGGLIYPLAFLFVLTVIVFVHELGHFLVARWFGVGVKTFSIGFGPEIAGWNDKHGTRWRVAWIPLGGYVKFMDDENAASVPSRDALARMSPAERQASFHAKPVGQRAAIFAAGPIASLLLGVAVFAGMAMTFGVPVNTAQVAEVTPDSPAAKAGFAPGDIIRSIRGVEVESFDDVLRAVSLSAGRELAMGVERDKKLLDIRVTPEMRDEKDPYGGVYQRAIIGIKRAQDAQDAKMKSVSPADAVRRGAQRTYFIISSTLGYLADVMTGRQSPSQIGGPLRIIDMSGEMAKLGPEYVVNLIGLLTVSIGLINLFPIPLLDGGHLMYCAIEALRGRALSERIQEFGFRIGLSLILLLMIFTFWLDGSVLKKWGIVLS